MPMSVRISYRWNSFTVCNVFYGSMSDGRVTYLTEVKEHVLADTVVFKNSGITRRGGKRMVLYLVLIAKQTLHSTAVI